jgi:hypothetical protein
MKKLRNERRREEERRKNSTLFLSNKNKEKRGIRKTIRTLPFRYPSNPSFLPY